tara:strand:+ start:72 stop:458 length:387 start_codon:yes stop_codon:yes gene_type:complete
MSKRARVDLANVLLRAGYDKEKTLRAIKYPFCRAIMADVRYADIPTDEMDVTVIFDPDYQDKMIIDTGRIVELEKPVPPMFSRLEYSQTAVFYFYYEDSDIPQSLFQPIEVKIPAPPEWPALNFGSET